MGLPQEIQTHLAGLSGKMMEPVIDDLGGDPNNVIKITDGFKVKLAWYLNSYSLGGQWEITVSLEGMGTRYEGDVVDKVVKPFTDIDAATSTPTHPHWVFEQNITSLPSLPGLTPGVYKVAVNILFKNMFGFYEPMAAFYEGPAISLY